MSYDIRLGARLRDVDGMVIVAEPALASPTYNIGPMLRAAMGWDFEQGHWYRVRDVLTNIEHGIRELSMNEAAYKPMNPSNGWGSTHSALRALKSLYECITEVTTEGTWQCEKPVPPEYLYLRW